MKLDNYSNLSRVAGMIEGVMLGVSEEFERILVDMLEIVDSILDTEEVEPN
jgi:hypothetical protein